MTVIPSFKKTCRLGITVDIWQNIGNNRTIYLVDEKLIVIHTGLVYHNTQFISHP